MSNEFVREERYFVFKISDVVEHLTATEALHLARLYEIQRVGRKEAGKAELECVVVESDWPEYESTWRAIEARATGTQQVPDGTAIQTAARILNIDLIRQRDELRAKIEQMEQIAPSVPREAIDKMLTQLMDIAVSNGANGVSMPDEYVEVAAWLCGIPAKPAPNAVAYLDLGVGGYMDVGTDLTDEELATLPKGRHMLGVIGTYGVDGYVPAQPAPNVPEGWQLVPTAESRHPGIYKMLGALHAADNTPGMSEWGSYRAMLSEAPEVKP